MQLQRPQTRTEQQHDVYSIHSDFLKLRHLQKLIALSHRMADDASKAFPVIVSVGEELPGVATTKFLLPVTTLSAICADHSNPGKPHANRGCGDGLVATAHARPKLLLHPWQQDVLAVLPGASVQCLTSRKSNVTPVLCIVLEVTMCRLSSAEARAPTGLLLCAEICGAEHSQEPVKWRTKLIGDIEEPATLWRRRLTAPPSDGIGCVGRVIITSAHNRAAACDIAARRYRKTT